MVQHPIFGLILSLFIVIIIIQECLQKGRVIRYKLVLSFINIFIFLVIWIIYDAYILKYEYLQIAYTCYGIAIYVLFGTTIIFLVSHTSQKMHNYANFINALKNTQWNVFYSTDKQDRIKAISDSFLNDLGLKKEEVIGKRAFDVFDSSIRFTKSNGADITNKDLREYYKDFKNKVKKDEEIKREIFFNNHKGEQVILNLIERPIFINNSYRGRLNIGQKKSDLSLLTVEKDLIAKNKDLESIKNKFIAILELVEDGIFFNNIDEQYIWANDVMVNNLNLSSNTITVDEYRKLIHPEDILIYTQTLEALTAQRSTYSIKYRFKTGHNYEIVRETGKKIFDDPDALTITGFINPIQSTYFEKTEFDELDNMKGVNELNVHLVQLFAEKRIFQLVYIQATNIIEINEKHGRNVGNLVMNEYIKQIQSRFITESSDIFRISGLIFAFTITDTRKIDLFRRGLLQDPEALNLKVEYGAMKITLIVNIGVADANSDGANAQEMINNSTKALRASLNENYRLNYVFYKDIK